MEESIKLSLRRQIKDAKEEIAQAELAESDLRDQLKALQVKKQGHQSLLQGLQRQLEAANLKDPVITAHSVLRYLERIEGVDIEAIRELILPADEPIRDAIRTCGNKGEFPVGTSHVIVMKNGNVVTVLNQSKDKPKKTNGKPKRPGTKKTSGYTAEEQPGI